MTRVSGWVRSLTEDVIGGSPVEIGKSYVHPDDGPITITDGQYWGGHGLSNHWHWRVLATGHTKHGYAGRWPPYEPEA